MKEFICVWGEGYGMENGRANVESHDEHFFTEELGYEPYMIADINSLGIGECYKITGMSWQLHSVARVA